MTDFRDRGEASEAEPCHLPKWVNAAGVCEHPDHDPPTCAWFALCDRPADGTVHHPILGEVPTCERCAMKLGLVFS